MMMNFEIVYVPCSIEIVQIIHVILRYAALRNLTLCYDNFVKLHFSITFSSYYNYHGVGEKNEGLSWGRSAVEMGLARMSAMGVFKPQEGTEEKKSQSFSSFNASMPIKPTSDKNETKSTKKPFGF
jgi:hypothetical protein